MPITTSASRGSSLSNNCNNNSFRFSIVSISALGCPFWNKYNLRNSTDMGTGFAQTTTPFMVFNTIDGNIDYLLNRYKSRMVTIKSTNQNPVNFVEDITKFLILNSENDIPETTYTKMDATVLSNLKSKVESSVNLFDSLKV